MTANAMLGDRDKYLNAGLDDYVVKPIDQRTLLDAIARQAKIPLPEFNQKKSELADVSNSDDAPLSEDTANQLSGMLDDLDELLDETG